MKAPFPPNETARLAALRSYDVLDTPPEDAFDSLTRLAALICGTPMAAICFLDEHRVWFKSRLGITPTECPRHVSFTAHGILQPNVFIVRDVWADERFAHNPMVAGEPRIRFHAGALLTTTDGYQIGMLGVNDIVPRDLTAAQVAALRVLSRQVVTQLELRRNLSELRRAKIVHEEMEKSLQERTNFLQLQQVVAATANEAATIEDAIQAALDLVCAYTGWPVGHVYLQDERAGRLLKPTDIWFLEDPERYRAFQRLTAETELRDGMGLPGRVLEQGTSIWIPDVTQDPAFPRGKVAAAVGIRAGVACPVWSGREVVAVLEFYSTKPIEMGDRLHQVLTYVGTQIGRVVERKRAEQALRESEARYRLLIQQASDGIHVCDANGKLLLANPKGCEMLGYSEEELLRLNVTDTYIEEEARVGLERMRNISPGENLRFEHLMRRKDGSCVPVEVSLSRLENGWYQAITRDISGRRQAEEQLRLQGTALEAAANGIVITGRNGDVRWVNEAFTKLTGYTLGEVTGKNPRVLKSGKHDGAFYKELWETITAGQVWHGEVTNRRKDGSIYTEEMTITPVRNARGEITHFIAIKQDVTDRKRAEESLRHRVEAENLLTTISTRFINLKAGEVNHAINETLAAIGQFVAVDRSYVFLASEDQKAVRNTHEWCAEGIESFFDRLQDLRADSFPWMRDKLLRGETVYVANPASLPAEADGERLLMEQQGNKSYIVAPMEYGHVPVGFIGFDSVKREMRWAEEEIMLLKMVGEIFINALKREEAEITVQDTNRLLGETLSELQRTQQQSIQQERLRALGQMASGIAHDFNNALAPILGFCELLLYRPDYLADKAKARHFLEVMHTAAKDAASIVGRLREFYRNREERELFTPVDLIPLVQQAISLTQPRWKDLAQAKGIDIRIETDLQKAPLIVASEPDLREMLTNLIFNAVDAMPQGGVITIHSHEENGAILIRVRDTGTGMTEEVRRRCLDPFFTTKGRQGTGLGLSMVHGIVRRHEGSIEIETEIGKGTTFAIRLPIRTAKKPAARTETAPKPARLVSVLVVDDEPMVREIQGEYLASMGHTVVTAASGPEALDKFRKGRFEVVVLDRAMPLMSGDQVAAAIKQLSPRTPVILLTGFGSMMQAAGEKPEGVDWILNKPVPLEELQAVVERAVTA